MSIDINGGSNSGAQKAKQPSTGAFGEDIANPLTAIFQATATYNTILNKLETFTGTGGTADATNLEFRCATNTSVGSYGTIRSARPLVYRAAQSLRLAFTTRFPVAGVANSLQYVGGFNSMCEMAVGYSGTTFGFIHGTGGAHEVQTLTVTGSTAGSDCDITLDGDTVSGITLSSTDTETTAAEISDALNADGTVSGKFYCRQVGSTVIAMGRDVGDKTGSFTVAGANITASWAETQAGAAISRTVTDIAEWDNPSIASEIDKTKGNVWVLSIPYLGYGNARLFWMNTTTGQMELAHVFKYANANTVPVLQNPSLRIGVVAASLGSTTALDVRAGSLNGSVEGILQNDIEARSLEASNADVDSVLESLLTIRANRTFNGLAFAGEVLPIFLSAVTASTKSATIEVFKGASFTDTQNFQYLESGQSCVEYDTTTYVDGSGWDSTTGTLVAAFQVGSGATESIDLSKLNIYLAAGETLTIAAKVNSGAASAVNVAIDWQESF